MVVPPVSRLGAEAHGEVTEGAHGAEGEVAEHHGLTPNAVPLFKLGPLVITNSMVVTWIVAALIILLSQMATRKAKLVPSGLQNFWEWLVEELYGFFESILGPVLVKKTFWFFYKKNMVFFYKTSVFVFLVQDEESTYL